MTHKLPPRVPADLRPRLEAARLDTLTLLRTIDRFRMADDRVHHPVFRALADLDADCAEALAVLLRPPPGLDWRAMVQDTEASLRKLPAARDRVRQVVDAESRAKLRAFEPIMRDTLDPAEAYNDIPNGPATIR